MTGKEPESLRRCVPSAATEPTRRQGATRVFARRADALGEARLIVGRQMQLTATPLRRPRVEVSFPAAARPAPRAPAVDSTLARSSGVYRGSGAFTALARRWLGGCLDQAADRQPFLAWFRQRPGRR